MRRSENNLRVLYQPGDPGSLGGKDGGFIEIDRESLDDPSDQQPFIPIEYARLHLRCFDLRHTFIESVHPQSGKNVEDVVGEVHDAEYPSQWIGGKGQIGESRYGRFTLSLFGSRKEFDTISVSIHRADDKHLETVAFFGMSGGTGLDDDPFDGFYVEFHLPSGRFDSIATRLREPGATLEIMLVVRCFPRFFAHWSPSVSDGRVIKFLGDDGLVENSDDIPGRFKRRPAEQMKIFSDPLDPPATISVLAPLGLGALVEQSDAIQPTEPPRHVECLEELDESDADLFGNDRPASDDKWTRLVIYEGAAKIAWAVWGLAIVVAGSAVILALS